ncbi:MAG: NAD(P)H-hydrate epimerase [Planctomycetia bacterium]|nr:NAD(P)H-hydrate epimerase [Planctomycetia bacterium]
MAAITISREQARQLDRRAVEDYGMMSVMLMENAGRGVADQLCKLRIVGPVVICCGSGNNGGDGLVIARHLDLRNYFVRVLFFSDPAELRGDAALNLRVLRRSDVPVRRADPADLEQELAGCSWVVDALLGTGARGEPRPPLDEVIDRINGQSVPVLSVDLPSGLDCDTGKAARHTIRAAHTCTFVAHKPGFLLSGVEEYTGAIHVIDIGAPRKLVDEILRTGASQQSSSE